MPFAPRNSPRVETRLLKYQEILSSEFPDFLKKYLSLKILTRLKGVGLLCGTDWTPLFKNKFYYSRFDHSVNCALIVWNWTGDKRQTISALLHDVSTPAFSHVIDFKNGDALTQSSTEGKNAQMIHADESLAAALAQDGLSASDVDDYHKFSICDNEVPKLSADRLEYMFPSGAALRGIFSLRQIERVYKNLFLSVDENGKTEFAFKSKKVALFYFKKCVKVGLVLQQNEDKMAMELLARVVEKALKCGALKEDELYSLTESQIIERWDSLLAAAPNFFTNGQADFLRHYKAFRTMKKIKRGKNAIPGHFCVSLEVKRRYINPLCAVKEENGVLQTRRICAISKRAEKVQKKYLSYKDAPYGCVRILEV